MVDFQVVHSPQLQRRSVFQLVLCLGAALFLNGCGVMANNKPLPNGAATATIHFGPVTGGFKSQRISVHDNEQCSRDGFARFKAIGSYLGSDADMEVPANKQLFISLDDSENGAAACGGGFCTSACGGGVAFSPDAGGKYSARLLYKDKKCAVVVFDSRSGRDELVAGQTHPKRCP